MLMQTVESVGDQAASFFGVLPWLIVGLVALVVIAAIYMWLSKK